MCSECNGPDYVCTIWQLRAGVSQNFPNRVTSVLPPARVSTRLATTLQDDFYDTVSLT